MEPKLVAAAAFIATVTLGLQAKADWLDDVVAKDMPGQHCERLGDVTAWVCGEARQAYHIPEWQKSREAHHAAGSARATDEGNR